MSTNNDSSPKVIVAFIFAIVGASILWVVLYAVGYASGGGVERNGDQWTPSGWIWVIAALAGFLLTLGRTNKD